MRSRNRTAWALAAVLALAPGRAGAEALAAARPEAVGFAPERLARVGAAMRQAAEQGRVGGVVTLVARHGRVVHFEAAGWQDVESRTPMRQDTLFRIASQSKAVTTVAAMMLVEEGRLLLGDKVSKYLPAFKQTRVLLPAAPDAPAEAPLETVAARREITVRDLMTHTAGISYGTGRASERYEQARVHGWYFADRDEPMSAVVERLAALPFDAQPGEKYVYGFATDVLGVVVEKASGLSLDEFFRTRVFAPLGMHDTHFFLPPGKAARLATVYGLDEDGALKRARQTGKGQGEYVEGPRRCFSGGAGLVSSARDYARFLEMLRRGGELDGVRLLGRKSVELMTSNAVGTLFENGRLGFGLGFEVTEHVGRSGRLGSAGTFGWGGAYYTTYWVDPEEGLVAVLMAQLLPATGADLHERFRTLVYQALVDAPEPAGTRRR